MTNNPRPKSEYSIQTVRNALRLLESFSEHDELGVSELSRRLSLHKNNVFRLLATLEEQGYIEQCSRSERYRLGLRCLELGRSFARGHSLLGSARSILEELTEHTGESSHLAVQSDYEVVHLDGQLPENLILSASRVGRRLPLHCTALGKVLLGCGNERARERFDRKFLRPNGLASRTASTITDRDKFFEHLRGVAVQGFALDLDETEVGLHCLAAPVFDAQGVVVAALSISGPAPRLSEERLLGELETEISDAAHRLSRALGHAS
jgi:IclR family KDG regulon transcriptional repressor